MSAVAAKETAHAHGGCSLEQSLCDQTIGFGDASERPGDGEHAVMDALDDLAHAGAHACLVAQVGHILACLPYDDPGLLGRDNGAEGELRFGVLFLGARLHVAVLVDAQALEGVGDLVGVLDGLLRVLCRHVLRMG